MRARPDFKRLRAIADEAQQLQDAGQWTEGQFLRIFQEARQHTGGVRCALGFLWDSAEPEWLERLRDK